MYAFYNKMLLVVATVAAPGRIVVVVSLPEYARQCAKLSALPAKKQQRKTRKKGSRRDEVLCQDVA